MQVISKALEQGSITKAYATSYHFDIDFVLGIPIA